jgi:hypothetical protein
MKTLSPEERDRVARFRLADDEFDQTTRMATEPNSVRAR